MFDVAPTAHVDDVVDSSPHGVELELPFYLSILIFDLENQLVTFV